MPRGAASPVFDRFISQWERGSIDGSLQTAHGGAQEKMRLIDRLIQGTKNADNGAFAGAGPMKSPGVSHVCKYLAFKKEQVRFTLKLNQTCPFFTI